MHPIPSFNLRRSERPGSKGTPARKPINAKSPSLRTIYIFCRAIPENLKLLWDRTVSGTVDRMDFQERTGNAPGNRSIPIRPWPSATSQVQPGDPPPPDERDCDHRVGDQVDTIVPVLKVTGKGIWL